MGQLIKIMIAHQALDLSTRQRVLQNLCNIKNMWYLEVKSCILMLWLCNVTHPLSNYVLTHHLDYSDLIIHYTQLYLQCYALV